jgi:hypothetical protein
MKKSEIKRRKRVIPATPDTQHLYQQQSPSTIAPHSATSVASQPSPSSYESLSPDPSTAIGTVADSLVDPSLTDHAARSKPHAPPPADFTTYRPPPSLDNDQDDPNIGTLMRALGGMSPRKRSFEETGNGNDHIELVRDRRREREDGQPNEYHTYDRAETRERSDTPASQHQPRGTSNLASLLNPESQSQYPDSTRDDGDVTMSEQGTRKDINNRVEKERRKETLRIEAERMRAHLRALEEEMSELD